MDDPASIVDMVGKFGWPAVLLVYLLIRDFRQGKRADAELATARARITELEADNRHLLIQMAERTHKVLSHHTGVLRDVCRVLRDKPCLIPKETPHVEDPITRIMSPDDIGAHLEHDPTIPDPEMIRGDSGGLRSDGDSGNLKRRV